MENKKKSMFLPPLSNLTLFMSKTVIAIVHNAIDVQNVHFYELFVHQKKVCCFISKSGQIPKFLMYDRYVEVLFFIQFWSGFFYVVWIVL